MKIRALHLATVCAAFLNTNTAHSAILLDVTEFTDSMISFSLSGSIPADATIGSSLGKWLYFGSPGNSGWVLSNNGTSNITNSGSPDRVGKTAAANSFSSGGDFIVLEFSSSDPFQAGETVALSGSIDATNFLDPGNVDVSTMIVSAGYNSTSLFPDPDTIVGAAVPEPSAYAAILGVLALSSIVVRRRFR